MQSLTKTEFQDALRKGLGRAVIYVRNDGCQHVEDDILYACLHNLAYDPQIEGDRSHYLFSLIDLTKKHDFFREPILEKLTKGVSNDWDEYNLLTLARQFAQRGDEHARKTLYAKFEQQQTSDPWMASEQIIELDGVEGLLFVVEILGARLLGAPEFVEDDYMIQEAYEKFGKETVLSALFERAESNTYVQYYLDKVVNTEKQENGNAQISSKQREELTLETILTQIEADSGKEPSRYSRYGYAKFGQNASDRDIEYLFTRFLAETRKEQLIRYLWLFKKRGVPRLDNQLFELAVSTDEALQYAAMTTLANTQDTRIREFALKLLEEYPGFTCQGAVGLFVKNYQLGDNKIIEAVLDTCDDIDDVHSLGLNLLNLAESNPYQELTNCILWVYETTPCSFCRGDAVEILIEWGAASESLLSECLWDVYDETRDLAEVALTKTTA